MPRIARIVIADLAHHVTQRGNGRRYLLASDAERAVYLDLLRQGLRKHELSLLGYCVMSNHVHFIAVPRQAADLAETFRQVHGRYASYWNAAHSTTGHAWQARFYSCPMDEGHLWTALRYAELNPVRAGMVAKAADWPWSSAAVHCGIVTPNVDLEMVRWRRQWSEASWRNFLDEGESEADLRAIRQSTRTGRPLGPDHFARTLEDRTERRLIPRRPGRPRKPIAPTVEQLVAM